MTIAIALTLHLLSAVIWVGGMFFAYVCLRPVAGSLLEAPVRLALWVNVFKLFFVFVWVAVLILPSTGYYLAASMFGGFARWPHHLWLMAVLGIAMILIFLHVHFAPYRRLRHAVDARDFQSGGQQLAQIRKLVGINTLIGLAIVIVAGAGRIIGF